jgi:hypothetical protein
MADDRNRLVRHALHGGVAGAAIDGVGAGLAHLDGPAHEIIGGAGLVEVVARHLEEAWRAVAVLWVEHELGRDRDDVDARAFGGFRLLQRQHAQHGLRLWP